MASQLFIYQLAPRPADTWHDQNMASKSLLHSLFTFSPSDINRCVRLRSPRCQSVLFELIVLKEKKKRARNYRVEKKSFFIKRTSSGGKKFSSLLASGISFNEISVLRNMLWSMREKVDEHSKWPKLFCCPWAETSSLEVFNSLRYSMALVGVVLKLR